VPAAHRIRADGARVQPQQIAFVRENTAADAVILSDQSFAVAWKAERRSIRQHFERTSEGVPVLAALRIHDTYVPLSGVLLSRTFMQSPPWRKMLERALRDPRFRDVFPLLEEFEDGAVFYYREDAQQ
jgi:hypothetical protein